MTTHVGKRAVPILIQGAAHALAFTFALSASVRAAYGVYHALVGIDVIFATVVSAISCVGTLIALWRLSHEEMTHYTDSLVNSYLDYLERDEIATKIKGLGTVSFSQFAGMHHTVMSHYRQYAAEADKIGLVAQAKVDFIQRRTVAELQQQRLLAQLKDAKKLRARTLFDTTYQLPEHNVRLPIITYEIQQEILSKILTIKFPDIKQNKINSPANLKPANESAEEDILSILCSETTRAKPNTSEKRNASLFAEELEAIDVQYGLFFYRQAHKIVRLTDDKLRAKEIKQAQALAEKIQQDEAADEAILLQLIQSKAFKLSAKLSASELIECSSATLLLIQQDVKYQRLLTLRRNKRAEAIKRHQADILLAYQNAKKLNAKAQQDYLLFLFNQRIAFQEQLFEAVQPRRLRRYATIGGYVLGIMVALSEGAVGSFSGKKLLLAAPLIVVAVAGWLGFHLSASIVFPPWAILLAGAIIAVAVFAAASTLIPPAVARITRVLSEKLTDGMALPSLKSIIKGIIVALLSIVAALGASLFVFMAVSNVMPSILALAIAASIFVFIEIAAFRGGRLYDELSFLVKFVQGKESFPWQELSTFQKSRALLGLGIASFVAFGTAAVAFVGVMNAPVTLALIGVASAASIFSGPFGIAIAIGIAIAAGICMAAIATRPLMRFIVNQTPTAAMQNAVFTEDTDLTAEYTTTGVKPETQLNASMSVDSSVTTTGTSALAPPTTNQFGAILTDVSTPSAAAVTPTAAESATIVQAKPAVAMVVAVPAPTLAPLTPYTPSPFHPTASENLQGLLARNEVENSGTEGATGGNHKAPLDDTATPVPSSP